jgi:hypothetical protein
MKFYHFDPPDGLGETLPKIRARPEDTFDSLSQDTGDFTVFHNAYEQTDVPPLRVNLGPSSDYRYVIYYPEQDRVEKKDRNKMLHLRTGPSLKRMKVQALRRTVLEKLNQWARLHPEF